MMTAGARKTMMWIGNGLRRVVPLLCIRPASVFCRAGEPPILAPCAARPGGRGMTGPAAPLREDPKLSPASSPAPEGDARVQVTTADRTRIALLWLVPRL